MKPRARFFNGKWFCKDEWAIGVGDSLDAAFADLWACNIEGCCPIDNELNSPWYYLWSKQ